MKKTLHKISLLVVGLAIGCYWLESPAVAGQSNIAQAVVMNSTRQAQSLPMIETIKVRIVKVQIKQGNLKQNQFIVLKNYGSSIDLKQLKLKLLLKDSVINSREINLGKLELDKTNQSLHTGEMLILVNNLELAKNFLNLQTNLVQCLDDCRSQQSWLELGKAKETYQLQLVHQPTGRVVDQFNYLKRDRQNPVDYHQFDNYDLMSLVTINGIESNVWQGFAAIRNNPIWLKAEQLPPLMSPDELLCSRDQELVGNKCLKKCPKNYSRNPNGDCERDPCSVGKILDKETDNCVTDPASCGDGYVYNYITKRCNKVKISEPKVCPFGTILNPATNRCIKLVLASESKTCPTGYFLNLETNRCNKITSKAVKSPCPEGQMRHPETNRCRKIVLESDCTDQQELVGNKCLKKCRAGYARNSSTSRCQKIAEACLAGFEKDPVTGICLKNNPVATNLQKNQQGGTVDSGQTSQNYSFDWLKILNSPLSGAVVASLIFAVYDKFFRTKN